MQICMIEKFSMVHNIQMILRKDTALDVMHAYKAYKVWYLNDCYQLVLKINK